MQRAGNLAYDRSIHLEQLEKARKIDSESAGLAASYVNNRASKDNLTQPGTVVKNEAVEVREADIKRSDRDTESVSNRSLLANAMEALAQNEIERNKIREYRGKIDRINAEEQKLQKMNRQLKEDVSRLREMLKLQRTVTNGTKFTRTSVDAAASAPFLSKHLTLSH